MPTPITFEPSLDGGQMERFAIQITNLREHNVELSPTVETFLLWSITCIQTEPSHAWPSYLQGERAVAERQNLQNRVIDSIGYHLVSADYRNQSRQLGRKIDIFDAIESPGKLLGDCCEISLPPQLPPRPRLALT